ncbi:MAG: hypothetical protein PVF33_04410, partial [Candidatus Latescibacterota bacterium]
MFVLRQTAFCWFFAAMLVTSTAAQDVQPYGGIDSLGLDPVLFLETGQFTNTRDGYTVVPGSDGRWYYARLNEFGNVVPTDVRLGVAGKRDREEQSFREGARKHLEAEPTVRDRLIRQAAAQKAAIERSRTELTEKGFASGSREIVVLGIEFPDLRAPYGIEHLDSLMNINTFDSGAGTGGFRDYYIENSYGQFLPNSHVYGWFEAEHPLSYYTDTLESGVAPGRLFGEALKQADLAGVNLKGYDFDGDRHADPVIVVTAAPASRIAARFSELVDPVKYQNFYFGPFTFQDVHLGNLVHEYGHALGLHDLYLAPHSFGHYDVMAYSCLGASPG